jgi:hypothetical protein
MPPVYLNHFFVVLNSQEFAAVRNSPFMSREFSAFEERTTSSQNQTWSGLYYYGNHTYFEFLPVGSLDGQKLRDCSIAFGVDHEGDSAAVASRLKNEFEIPVDASVIYRGEEKIPWFHLLLPRRSIPVPWFETWVMEYHNDFLGRWNPTLPPASKSISRETILARYKASVIAQPSNTPQIFEDVESILVALPPEDMSRFKKWLGVLGFLSKVAGDRTDFVGPDITVSVIPVEGSRKGILEATFKLSRPLERMLRFGDRCVLRPVNGKRAKWTFVDSGVADRK